MRDDMTTLHFNEEHDDWIGVHPKSYSLIPSLYPWNYNRWLSPRNLIPAHPNIDHDAYTPEILDKPIPDCGHGAMHCAVFYGSTVLPRVKAAELHQSLNELPRDCPICIAKGTSFKSSTCSACKEKQVISSHFWRFFHSKHLRRSVTVAAVVPVPRLSAIGVWVKPPWAQFIRCGASDAGESGQTRADGRDGHVNFKHRRRICRAQGLGV